MRREVGEGSGQQLRRATGPAIGAPEHTDNVRSGLMPCATFTGDFGGKNQVFQYKSETTYPGGIGLVVFDGPNGGYLWAGGIVPGSGQYVSKLRPLDRQGDLAHLSDQRQHLGPVARARQPRDHRGRHARRGRRAHVLEARPADAAPSSPREEQPIEGTPAIDHNFDGMVVAPDEQGTLLIEVPDAIGRLPDADQQRDVLVPGRLRRRAEERLRRRRPGHAEEPRLDRDRPERDRAHGGGSSTTARSTCTATAPRAWSA